jgi:CubicO group peptidase (beta-lactamase class C family)
MAEVHGPCDERFAAVRGLLRDNLDSGAAVDPASPAYKTFTGPAADAAAANTPGWRRADIGAANGHGNARSVARVMSVLARGGEVDGVRLLRPDTIDLVFRDQTNGTDLVLGVPLRFGLGYALPRPEVRPWAVDEKVCFWGGWGGSVIIMDASRRMTISYMMNKMGAGMVGSARSSAYSRAIYRAVHGWRCRAQLC